MKRIFIFVATSVLCGIMAPHSAAQGFALKAYGDIALGNSMSLTTTLPCLDSKSSSNAFGLDFGWTFWEKNANSLEANIGIGYRLASATFYIASMSYRYSAPASADVDGNTYERYTSLSNVEQKINLGYFNIPLYLQYQYRPVSWLGIHADVGLGFGFKCTGIVDRTTGSATCYGVYPEYDQLVIKADYLNDFGESPLDEASADRLGTKGFSASVLAGAGLEFYVGGPVSIDLGIRYYAGLTSVFGNRYSISSTSDITAGNAPVTYTVAGGQNIKALSDYVTKSHLNPFSLHIGVNMRF